MEFKIAEKMTFKGMIMYFKFLKLIESLRKKFIIASQLGTLVILMLLSFSATAEPTSPPVKLSLIRAYSNGDIFISTTTSTFCNTDTFKIPATYASRKELVAILLTARALDSFIQIEVSDQTRCAGWGTNVQSIYLYSQ
jgi:hypothetical protein